MTNEIILTRSVKSGNITLPEFKKEGESSSIALEPRRLKISAVTKKKKAGGTFKKVTGYVKLECFDEDGNSLGIKVKGLSVHFKKKAFTKSANVTSPEDLKPGYLYVVAKALQIPSRWQPSIKKDSDGNEMYDDEGNAIMQYPVIWIDDEGVIGLEEFVTSQDALNVDEDSNVVDAKVNDETGEITEDFSQYDTDESEEVNL